METVYSFKGQGGKEKIYEIFANDILKLPLKRQSHKLYDFVNLENDQKIEFKKQCNQQWFDASKYYNLSDNDNDIVMHFLMVNKNGNADKVYEIKTKTFIDTFFDKEYIRMCHEISIKFPRHQNKIDFKILDLVIRPEFKLIWEN